METIVKDLKLPKEVTEIQEALPLPEPEPQGIGSVSYTHLTLPTTPYV